MKQSIKSITIGLAVKDINKAAHWYKNLLGNVEKMEPAPGVVELKVSDNAWLQFDDTGYLTAGGSIVRFQTDDIRAAHDNVKKFATSSGEIQFVEGVIRYFDFEDPWGNRLSYFELI